MPCAPYLGIQVVEKIPGLLLFAVVMAVGGSRFFDVYVPALGVDVRVHTNSVLKGGDGALESQWDAQAK